MNSSTSPALPPIVASGSEPTSSTPQDQSIATTDFSGLTRYSHSLMAAIAPESLTVLAANAICCEALEIPPPDGADRQNAGGAEKSNHTGLMTLGQVALPEMLSMTHGFSFERWYRRQVFCRVWASYHPEDPRILRWLDEPQRVVLHGDRPHKHRRYFHGWLQPGPLQVRCREGITDPVASWPCDRETASLDDLEQQFDLGNYEVSGWLFLEAVEVTIGERIYDLTKCLLNGESILHLEKFQQVGQILRHIFRADQGFVLRTDGDQVQISRTAKDCPREVSNLLVPSSVESGFLRAISACDPVIIADISHGNPSALEQYFLDLGVRSVLLIPLRLNRENSDNQCSLEQLSGGVVGLASRFPNHFDRLDKDRAYRLSPALTAALRESAQSRFSHIHPAVTWRFAQEAERRSWGLKPEPLVFENVYPLYGISDLRGSSLGRDLAIQTDLLTQFRLAIATLDAACKVQDWPLLHQLRQDTAEYLHEIEMGVTVEAEVKGVQFLQRNFEVHLDYLSRLDGTVNKAVTAYREAWDEERQSVYRAQAKYDATIGSINRALRKTWDRWQVRMQGIASHYCDVDATDGLDHMIYAGASIAPGITPFHLQNLRYEQLRAMCACARTGFRIEQHYDNKWQLTHLVLTQGTPVDIVHDETTEKLFNVRGTRDTRYEIVKKRIDKARDAETGDRITQPGQLTIVFATDDEMAEYKEYLRYLTREKLVAPEREYGEIESLQGANGLRYIRVRVLPDAPEGQRDEDDLEVIEEATLEHLIRTD
ncbi:MAG: GAF domain-containing protein [Cyanobacteria bacterium P01_F01_bin.153]